MAGGVRRILELVKIVLEEVDIAFVVFDQELEHILSRDDALQLTALVCCQSNGVQIVIV